MSIDQHVGKRPLSISGVVLAARTEISHWHQMQTTSPENEIFRVEADNSSDSAVQAALQRIFLSGDME